MSSPVLVPDDESTRSPPPSAPQFQTLKPDEIIDFAGFRDSVLNLQDQCTRLMGSLEEARRTIQTVTAEKDHYIEFWQAMNNYHSVMARFQVVPPISFPHSTPHQAANVGMGAGGFPMFNPHQGLPSIGTGGTPFQQPYQTHDKQQEGMGQSPSQHPLQPQPQQQTSTTGSHAPVNNPAPSSQASPP